VMLVPVVVGPSDTTKSRRREFRGWRAGGGRYEDIIYLSADRGLAHSPIRRGSQIWLSQSSRNPPRPRAARDVAVNQGHCADYDTIADRHTHLDHALRPDIDAGADFDGCLVDGGDTAAETARDGMVRINLRAGADITMVPDRQTALPVEDHVGADPAMLPNFDIAEDQDIVVTRRALSEPTVTSNFPSIGQKIADRNVATKFLPHLAT
jgi:hypothetical protein